jgi:hypothetical protein
MSKNKTSVTHPVNHELANAMSNLMERATALATEAAQLEQQLLRVRGTRDLVLDGKQTPSDYKHHELYEQLKAMLTKEPMHFRDIVEQTKAEENPVKVCLMKMQRDAIGLVNLGNQFRAVWFIPDAEVLQRLRLLTVDGK